MQKKDIGQRQDVAFLALAVAALAVAVAIFVGIRALPKRPREESKPEPVAQAEPAKPAVAKPAETDRDPFAAQAREAQRRGARSPREEFRLVGIIRGREPLAAVRRGNRHYYAKAGQAIGGYTLVAIGRDRVTLVRGEERITLELRPPLPEEEAAESAAEGE